jgi:PAS domain S-box-containing protein
MGTLQAEMDAPRMAEDALRESEARFRQMADAIPSLAWTALSDGTIDYYNQRWYDYTGLTFTDTGGWNWDRVIHPDDLGDASASWRSALQTSSGSEIKQRLRRADGVYRWFLSRTEPIFDAFGGIVKWVGTGTDIEALKRAEEEQYRLAAIVNSSDDAIVGKTLEGIITSWNPGAEKVFGYSAAEAVGRSMLMLFPPERVGEEADFLARIARGESVRHFDTVRVRKDGERIDVSVTLSPIFCADGRIIGVSKIARDISERKQAEAALRNSEERFRAYIEQVADPIFVHDFFGRLLEVNQQACVTLGYTREELLSMSVFDLETEFDMSKAQAAWAGIRQNEPFTLLGSQRRKDGSVFPVEIRFGCFDLENERRYLGIVRDITERKRAEEELRESEALLHTVTDDVGVGLVLLDADRRYLFANAAYADVLSLPSADIVGRRVADVLPQAYDQIGPKLDRAFRGERVTYDLTVTDADGGPRTCAVTYEPRTHAVGGTQVLVMVVDITERKRAEDRIRESEERFRTMADAIPHLAWMAEPDGSIFWYNQRWFDYTGTTPAEMEGRGKQSVHDPDILPSVVERWTQAIASGAAFEMEFPLRGADGRFRAFLTRVFPLRDAAGRIVRWFGTNTDVSEMREAEAEIQALNQTLERRVEERTVQLEATNRELEAFSYSVSHDLRAPLRSIDGFSQALLEDYSGCLDGEGQDFLRRVRAASQRMSVLIDDLLQISRVTRTVMQRQSVDLSVLARGVFQELADGHPGRLVESVIAPGLRADADPHLLRIALENLLGNAWKYTAKHATARIEVGEAEYAGRRCFFVRDDGAGFDMAYADKLFTPFQRLHAQREFDGTGIGLATVQRIFNRHGGGIWAEAAVEQGATFYFSV